jgi:hypothetical protein
MEMDYIKMLYSHKTEIEELDNNTDYQTFEGLLNIFEKIQEDYNNNNVLCEFEIFTDNEYQTTIEKYLKLFDIDCLEANDIEGITHYTLILQ